MCRRALVLAWLLAAPVLAYAQTDPAAGPETQVYEKIVEARGSARTERYAEALSQLGEAVSLAEQAGNGLSLAVALHNLAEVRLLKGEPLAALRDYYRVLGVYTQLGHPSGAKLAQERIEILSRLVTQPRTPPAPGTPETAAAVPAEGQGPEAGAAPAEPSRTEETVRLALVDQAVDRIRRRREEKLEHPPVEGVRVTRAEPRQEPGNPREWAYVEALRRKIGGNARYPEYARRTRQQGTVDLVLVVRDTGAVEGVSLSRSSGFIVLDVEALRNVRESAPFAPLPDGLAETPLTVRLTLHYELPDTPAAAP